MNHRSEWEIKWWLRTKTWYRRYKRNLHLTYDDIDKEMEILNGKFHEQTISAAFLYSTTPEGLEYWGKVEERFLRWYYFQGKEIFRCKWFTIQI